MRYSTSREQQGYRPGQCADVSGVYRVVHRVHRADHDVIVLRGEEFPPCRTCHELVRFYRSQVVLYATDDMDLAGPAPIEPIAAPATAKIEPIESNRRTPVRHKVARAT